MPGALRLLRVALVLGFGASMAASRTAATELGGSEADARDPSAEQRARAFFKRGQASYRVGGYDAAIAFFKAGYDAAPLPLFLYNIGSSARRAGHLDEARDYFRRYLTAAPHASERQEINGWLKEIERALRIAGVAPTPPSTPVSSGTPPGTPIPSPVTPIPSPVTPAVSPVTPAVSPVAPQSEIAIARRAPHRNRPLTIAGFSIFALGLGAVAGGGALDAGAAHANDEIAHPRTGWVFDESVQTRRDREASAAIGMYIGGGVLAAGGLALGLVGLRRR